jgi:hypothetical protein
MITSVSPCQWGTPEDGAFFSSTLRDASDRHRRLLSTERGAAKAALQVGPGTYCLLLHTTCHGPLAHVPSSGASAGEVEFVLTAPHVPRAMGGGEERLVTCSATCARP